MTKIIRVRNVPIVLNIKAKPLSHISGRRSGFLALCLRSPILGLQLWALDLESQDLGPEF